mmetsp:Transcript_29012/g.67503  ORF Transcript_29012/g.67503 Transcript_29012/m.67503 type:complete len:193 (-) Transcript_29012:247-825(-)
MEATAVCLPSASAMLHAKPSKSSRAATAAATEAHQRRKVANLSLSSAATKILLAICSSVPGRAIPTTKICVDDRVRLRDVLAAWVAGVMKDVQIPAAMRAVGRNANDLDLDSTLRILRPQLPVRDGRLTVSVIWPAGAAPLPTDSPAKATHAVPSRADVRSRSRESAMRLSEENARKGEGQLKRGRDVQGIK